MLHAQLPAVSFNHLKRDDELFASKYNSLFEDQYGFMWFGSITGGGLYRYDGYNVRPFTTDPAQFETSISSPTINCIYPVNDTMLYVGTLIGYSIIHLYSGHIQNFNNVIENLENDQEAVTYNFLQDSVHHTLWIGTADGLSSVDHQSGFYKQMHPLTKDGTVMPSIKVTQMLQDPLDQNIIFLGGQDGAYRYFISTNTIEPLVWSFPNETNYYICELALDNQNNLWIGTHSDKLYRYKIAADEWTSYTIPVAKLTPHQTMALTRVLPVDETKIWIAALSHIGLFNPVTGQFDGLEYSPDNPSGLLPYYHYLDLKADRHGKLWVASWYGIQYSNQIFMTPSGSVKNLKVAITDLEIKPLLVEKEKALMYTNEVNLDKQQRDITFHYVLPNPLYPSNVLYQYRLEGFDKEWITTDQRSIRYGKLGGGQYHFQIKAQDGKNGAWTSETSLTIIIPKMITELLWFWIAVAISILGIGIAVFKYMMTRSRKQAQVKAEFEHQLSEIQMQALRAQMNPHFLFNSLNSIKYFAISKSKDETAAYLSKFALLVRTILTNSKSRTISLKEELDALRLYIEIEHLRLEGKFDYEINIDSGIHIRQAQIPPMILQPFVENAIWHGLMHKEGKGILKVYVQEMGRQIQCRIEDNGIGRARSAELKKKQVEHRKSEGMQITADRIALINRIYNIQTEVDVIDLHHPDGSPAGTRVVIHIPLIRDEEE